jgi:hypothetical protein
MTRVDLRRFARRAALGALALIVLACSRGPAKEATPNAPAREGVVATVNGVPIDEAVLNQAMAALAKDRREPLSEADRRYLLDRLIDEELLVQFGLSEKLAESDRAVRTAIVGALMEREKAYPCPGDCGGDDLRAFFEAHKDEFREGDRLRARSLWFSNARPDVAARAAEARASLAAGEPFEAVRDSASARDPSEPPAALMTVAELARYLGPTAAETAAGLEPGAWSEPIETPGGFRLVGIVEKQPGREPRFEDVRSAVRARLERQAREDGVRRLIERLRKDARIVEAH